MARKHFAATGWYGGLILLGAALFSSCTTSLPRSPDADAAGFTAPTPATAAANRQMRPQPHDPKQSGTEPEEDGLIAAATHLTVTGPEGSPIWSLDDYDFLAGTDAAPDSVHPGLWRQARLNSRAGLYKVTDGIYQLRGFDLANMTLIQGQTGWIVVDVLTSAETARAALTFARQHLGRQPIRAILFTHSHIDHFGGIDGVLSFMSAAERKAVRVIAPKGFLEEATSENVLTGPAMSRRAMYMYGTRLPRSPRGHVDSGLGKAPALGTHGIVTPTEWIDHTPQTLTLDGVPFVFQFTPGAEAPAEFTFYLPDRKAFCGAEVVSHTLHNLYTLRGAKVRDALQWSRYIDQARTLFGDATVYFGSHHWPIRGQAAVQSFLRKQSDLYRYIHDQTIRLINAGFTPSEIADQLRLPESLSMPAYNHGYYGTVKHNARAVYQRYMGWYNGNPAELDPLPETEAARRTLALMGGVAKVVDHARARFDAVAEASPETAHREYRWLAQLLNQAVLAEPDNRDARALLARVYDQLGYLSESGPWRDEYLTAAWELRHGAPDKGLDKTAMKNVLMHTPPERFLDTLAASLNGPRAEGVQLRIRLHLTDLNQSWLLRVDNAVLQPEPDDLSAEADATLHLTRELFVDILIGNASLKRLIPGDELRTEGSVLALIRFFSLLDKPGGTLPS
ncbi:alkyl sulfatase dimerization domain-containing protein [Hahella sp. SMD15-11]|uniref:Alkyl sulfatase dimerization domain-containing protein n=1 Tax=Thermohahella caldifontis TaxID=3142973 RepID=A0AB39UVP4_9GAMM